MEPATTLITPHPKANLGDLLRHHLKLLELQQSGDSLKLVCVHTLVSSIPLWCPGTCAICPRLVSTSTRIAPTSFNSVLLFLVSDLLLPTEPEPRHARHTIHHGYVQASVI